MANATKDPNVVIDTVTGIQTSTDPVTGVVTETDLKTKKVTVMDPANPGFTPVYLNSLAQALHPYLANLAPARMPRIDSVSPVSGIAGDRVELRGHALSVGSVSIAGVPAEVVSQEDSKLTFVVPSGAPNGAVVVRNGPLSASVQFITGFIPSDEALSVASINPTTGLAGSKVSVKGTGLTNVRSVLIGDTQARFVTVNDSELTVEVPQNSDSGVITVDTGTYSAESTDSFKLLETAKVPVSPRAPKPVSGKPAVGTPANK